MVQLYCIVFELRKCLEIMQIQNSGWTPILKLFAPKKLLRLTDIAEHICQIKIRSDGNFSKSAILKLISAKFVMGYPCVIPDIMVQLLWLFLSYVYITKLLKFKVAEIVFSQKLIRSLADIAANICQIKRRSDEFFSWNTLASISSLVAVVIKESMIWDQNVTKTILQW